MEIPLVHKSMDGIQFLHMQRGQKEKDDMHRVHKNHHHHHHQLQQQQHHHLFRFICGLCSGRFSPASQPNHQPWFVVYAIKNHWP